MTSPVSARKLNLPLALFKFTVDKEKYAPLTAGGASVSEHGATTPRRMVMRHLGGRGAEERVRGAEPREA